MRSFARTSWDAAEVVSRRRECFQIMPGCALSCEEYAFCQTMNWVRGGVLLRTIAAWHFYLVVKRCRSSFRRRWCSMACRWAWTPAIALALSAATATASPRCSRCSRGSWSLSSAALSARTACRWACSGKPTRLTTTTRSVTPSWATSPNTSGRAMRAYGRSSRESLPTFPGRRLFARCRVANAVAWTWRACSWATTTSSCSTSPPTTWMCAPSTGLPNI